MPLNLVGRTKDAVVVVATASPWQDGVRRFLAAHASDAATVERHVRVLEERAAGHLPWVELLDGALLPNGRPMPPARRYAEMLVHEDRLPLHDAGPLRFSVDLHNPGNEAGLPEYDAELLELAIVADVGAFAPAPGTTLDLAQPPDRLAAERADRGAVLGDLVADLVEATTATFAYADIGSTGWRVTASTHPESAVHPAPAGTRPWDFLWSITAWGGDLLAPELAHRLETLEITAAIRERLDRFEREHHRIERRTLASGAAFLQFRWLFGSELRATRAAIDTPLASQLGLRSTSLLLRG